MKDKIAELTTLEAKATPGPWEAYCRGERDYLVCAAALGTYAAAWTEFNANAVLIAAMRNALPELLELIKEMPRGLMQVCIERNAALARAEKAEDAFAKATEQNMAGMLEASSMVFEGILKGISGKQTILRMGFTCPYCDKIMTTAEEATAHDGVCVKHPAVIRAEKVEAERDVLAEYISMNIGCPDDMLPTGCPSKELATTCVDEPLDDDGFKCWISWAGQEAAERGEG